MTREEEKDFMWIENDKNPTIIRWQHHSTISRLVSNLIDKIFDDHEAQLKAKDEKIAELEQHVKTMYKLMLSGENRGVQKGIVKARSIVAMLFWEWRKIKYWTEDNLAISFSEDAFKKAYKLLKDTPCV